MKKLVIEMKMKLKTKENKKTKLTFQFASPTEPHDRSIPKPAKKTNLKRKKGKDEKISNRFGK